MTTVLTPAPDPAAPAPPARLPRERWALGALLVATAVLHLWDLSVNGWGNAFYAGAVQSMTRSGEAFFFGGADAGGIITVDKPPASLWVMAASAEVFGLSSWSLLVPQALMGVGTVALVHAAVRRTSGPGAALVAGVVMALTPVAVLMFRFDNPDALLVLLLAGAAYAVVRAVEAAGTRWLLLAGALIGFAFLTKTAQALLVVPGLALAYLWAAPTGLGRRIRQLLAAGLTVVVSGGWWFVVVDLWPAADRPYIGGSTTNSALELALGYNGLGRLFGAGADGGAGGGFPGGGAPFGGGAGLGRLFSTAVGGQIAWLLPAALVLLAAGLLLTRRAPRTDAVRASLLLWGGWTLVTAAVLSLMSGIFHEYYTVALAPGIAALVGVGGAELWRRREHPGARAALAAVTAGSAVWAAVLLLRTPDLAPGLAWATAALGTAAAAALLVGRRRAAVAGLVAGVVAASLGPAAYAVDTVSSARTGSIVLAGPATTGPGGGTGGPGGPGGVGPASTDVELVALLQAAGTTWSAATPSTAASAQLALDSGTDVIGIGGFSGSDPAPTLEQFQALVAAGQVRYYVAGAGPGGPGAVDPRQLLEQLPPDLREDPQLVEQLESGGFPGGGGRDSAIATWVEEGFAAVTVGGTTVHDLAAPVR